MKCLVAPDVPNNAGSLAPITVSAPEGCVLNVKRPWPVAARHTVGHMLPDVVFGCLHQVMAGGVPAEGASACGACRCSAARHRGRHASIAATLSRFTRDLSLRRHRRAAGQDGLSATAFPSRVRTIPVEATETIAPVVFWRREFRESSGGAGRYRGGLGQTIEIGGAGTPLRSRLPCNFERVKNPARGRDGGKPGAAGSFGLMSGRRFEGKHKHTVPAGERLLLELPGGGGYGDPLEREAERVADDVRLGLVSPDVARHAYGVVVDHKGAIDETATDVLRSKQSAHIPLRHHPISP